MKKKKRKKLKGEQMEKQLKIILDRLDEISDCLNEKLKKIYTIEEAADFLGVSVNSMYYYTSRRLLNFFKPQKRIYFKREDLENFAFNNRNRVSSLQEIDENSSTKILTK